MSSSIRHSSIPFRTLDPTTIQAPHPGMEAPRFPLALQYCIPHSLLHPISALHVWDKHSSIPSVLHSLHWLSSMSFRTPTPSSFDRPQFHSALLHPPLLGLLNFIPYSLTPPLSALVRLNLTLFCFILRFPNTFCGTPLFHTTLHIWRSSCHLVVVPIFHPNVSYCLSYPHFDSQLANISLHLC